MAKVIFLNGCSSAGKSSLARALQHLSPTPLLHLGVDWVVAMLPAAYRDFGAHAARGYYTVKAGSNAHGPTMHIAKGPLSERAFAVLPSIAKVLVDAGNDLIIDEVLLEEESFEAYRASLCHTTLYFIGVMCDLSVMQEREILRQDRLVGMAADQVTRVHKAKHPYDLIVDTTCQSAFACAREILDFIDSTS